jgi:hypothetical protein
VAADRPDSPQPAISGAERETFRPAVKITAAFLSIVVFLALAEVVLRVASHFGGAQPTAGPGVVSAPLYTQEELRRDLSRFTARQGRDCIEIRTGSYIGIHASAMPARNWTKIARASFSRCTKSRSSSWAARQWKTCRHRII